MKVTTQIIYWRDIPAQVKARSGRERVTRALAERFQEAIDEAAMRARATSEEDYLDEWHSSELQEKEGDLQGTADSLVAQLEAAYPQDRLDELIEKKGFEQRV
jgi:hypothetical protein